jgi:hypothetical protein
MALPGTQQKPVELSHKLSAPSDFVGQALPFCPKDLPLKRVFVQSSKDLIQTRPQIQLVKPVRTTRSQTIVPRTRRRKRPKLHIPPMLKITCLAHPVRELFSFIAFVEQRLAVIRKRQRYQASSCYPTRDSTHQNPVIQRFAKRCACQHVWFIAISAK